MRASVRCNSFGATGLAFPTTSYEFPPLWGPGSYIDGAGMTRPNTAANFIRANMPFGTDYAHPVPSAQNAFDVAVRIDSQPRPYRLGNEPDFPDRALKPADATTPVTPGG
jgi:thiosulfate dehydrogenase